MHVPATDNRATSTKAVANTIAERRPGSDAAYQIVDNHPEAMAQRQLQEMANNSVQVKQLRALQQMADNRSRSGHLPGIKRIIQKTSSAKDNGVLMVVSNVPPAATANTVDFGDVPAKTNELCVKVLEVIDGLENILPVNAASSVPEEIDLFNQYKAILNNVIDLKKTLIYGLTNNNFNRGAIPNFVDAEKLMYSNEVKGLQLQLHTLTQSQQLSTNELKTIRNKFDQLHLLSSLINDLLTIEFSKKTSTKPVSTSGYEATFQLGRYASVSNVPNNGVYLWNIIKLGTGGSQLMNVLKEGVRAVNNNSNLARNVYFHAQPWVKDIYVSNLGATEV